jgi:hypothetical protein
VKEIILSQSECRLANYIGKVRNKLSLETKINGRRDPNQDDETMNIEAMGGELAVAKYLNIYPDLSPTRGKLPEWDLIWNGYKVQVKRNHLQNGDLLVPKCLDQLVYILVCGACPNFTIIGYLVGYSVKLLGSWVQLTYGPCWRVNPSLLIPIERIFTQKEFA